MTPSPRLGAKPRRLPSWLWFVLLWAAGVASVMLAGGLLRLVFDALLR